MNRLSKEKHNINDEIDFILNEMNKNDYDMNKPYITFRVAENLTYDIHNTYNSLIAFKKVMKKYPVTEPKAKMKIFSPRKPPTKPSNKILNDFQGQYKIHYKTKKSNKIIEMSKDKTSAGFYSNNYFSNGEYVIKTNKPRCKRPLMTIPDSIINIMISKKDTDITFIDKSCFFNFSGKKDDNVNYITIKDCDLYFNTYYIDLILSKFPLAETYINNNILYFFINDEIVGLVINILIKEPV